MDLFRRIPQWQMLVFYYGFGLAVTWQFIEDLYMGQGLVHSGEFAPWRQRVHWEALIGLNPYPLLATAEAILLVLYFLRFRIGITALLLAGVMFADNLGCFLNHRLLMSMEMFLIALVPPRGGTNRSDELLGYWNLDIIRYQVSLVYVTTAIHKLNEQFLSGETLHNLFFMANEHGMTRYPDWLLSLLQRSDVCVFLAWSTIIVELILAFALHHRVLCRYFLPVAFGLHLSFGLFMPYIWIFTTQMLFTIFLFHRSRAELTLLAEQDDQAR